MSIDWSLPIEAVSGAKTIAASIDHTYAARLNATAIRIARNIWSDDHDGGTWYFNNDGLAVGGLDQDGYNGRYTLRNR